MKGGPASYRFQFLLMQVAINGCSHMMCCSCAISLCEVHKKPPLCPFCRCMIAGFHIPDPSAGGALPKIVL